MGLGTQRGPWAGLARYDPLGKLLYVVNGRRPTWTKGSVGSAAVSAELDPDTQSADELVRAGRVEIRWGGSNVKYVELRDRRTGLRASGRSYVSWNVALGHAAQKMRWLLDVEADQ